MYASLQPLNPTPLFLLPRKTPPLPVSWISKRNSMHKQGLHILNCFWLVNQVCFICLFNKYLMSILCIPSTVLASGSAIWTRIQPLPSKSLQSSRDGWRLTKTHLLENEKWWWVLWMKRAEFTCIISKIMADRVSFPNLLIQKCGWDIGSKNITLNLYSCQQFSSFPSEFSSDKMACWELV